MKAQAKILFNEASLPFILEAIGNKINDKGYVVDADNKNVTDPDNKKVKAKNLIGIVKNQYITSVFQVNLNK